MNSFADEAKYDVTNVPGAQIAQDYEDKRTDAWSLIENLNIIKRIISVCAFIFTAALAEHSTLNLLAARLVQANRSQTSSLGRQPSTATTSSLASSSRVAPPSNPAFKKAPPPPPPGASSHAAPPPPPYTPSSSGAASAAAAKRAPPPPPPLKPKPKIVPQVQYVIALYDFAAQVCSVSTVMPTCL